MDSLTFDQEALRRVPLAEAVLLTLDQVSQARDCLDLFDRHRDRCYHHLLAFDTFVALVRDALLHRHGSGRQACAHARSQGALPVSNQAFYDKLGHVPLALSEAFLVQAGRRLLPLLPDGLPSPVPATLQPFHVAVFDGKVTKRVAKRLKALRPLTGGALGGKGLVAMDLATGLVTGLVTSADGHANDASLVKPLVDQVRAGRPADRRTVWVGDAQFADLTQPTLLLGPHRADPDRTDHFVLRYSAKTRFTADPEAAEAKAHPGLIEGTDDRGRGYRQEWGRLGRPGARGGCTSGGSRWSVPGSRRCGSSPTCWTRRGTRRGTCSRRTCNAGRSRGCSRR